MKLLTIIGARPQFIKAAVVSRILSNPKYRINEIIVHTGQHYNSNMSDIFFSELEIPRPKYNLDVGSGSHGKQTGEMLAKIETVLLKEQPDRVLVYGDTNSTIAGSLSAAKLNIPVAHVEAGLRSFNRAMPEEINRILTDQLSDLLFCPTKTSNHHLKNEGIASEKCYIVGDVMYDAALYYGEKADKKNIILAELGLHSKSFILATIHRAENTDDPRRLKAIFEGLVSLGKNHMVILPMHPRTHVKLEQIGLLAELKQAIKIIEPVGYLDMVMLEKNAKLIVTDSGGVQKEAFFHQVPCVTLRDETE